MSPNFSVSQALWLLSLGYFPHSELAQTVGTAYPGLSFHLQKLL